jgi:hypothetical protein
MAWIERLLAKSGQSGEEDTPTASRIAIRAQFEELVEELNEIGSGDGFLSLRPGMPFDFDGHHARAKEIGRYLDALGGPELMRRARQKVACPNAQHLDAVWDGIGGWVF